MRELEGILLRDVALFNVRYLRLSGLLLDADVEMCRIPEMGCHTRVSDTTAQRH
jgi:hypothetical protein